MKRSNSLENCLTLRLYFWISSRAKDCWDPDFPQRFSCLGMQWNLGNVTELGRRLAGIRERSEYFLKTFRSIVFKTPESQIWKELSPTPALCRKSVCFILHRTSLGFPWMLLMTGGSLFCCITSFTLRKVFPLHELKCTFLQGSACLLVFVYKR